MSIASLLKEPPPRTRKRIPKCRLKRILQSGKYDMELSDGSKITDWNGLLEDYTYDFYKGSSAKRAPKIQIGPVEAIKIPAAPTETQVKNGRRTHLYCKQDAICFYCDWHTPFSKWTIDHRVALSKGGRNTTANIVGACTYCNNAKGSISEADFNASEFLKLRKRHVASSKQKRTA